MLVQNWIDVLRWSLQDLWQTVVAFLPSLIGALVVFVIGLLVAAVLERLVERVIYYLKIDVLLRKTGIETYLSRANLTLNTGHFIGQLVYWFLIVAFLLAASDILGFTVFSDFLKGVLDYIPSVIIAVLIVLAAMVLANFLKGLIVASVMSAKMHYAKALGGLAWWVVIIFGLLVALERLGMGSEIILTLVMGFIAMLALAGGLAFGLGGKEYAGYLVQKMKDEVEGR